MLIQRWNNTFVSYLQWGYLLSQYIFFFLIDQQSNGLTGSATTTTNGGKFSKLIYTQQ